MPSYQRTGHIVKRNHSNALPRYIVSVYVNRVREQLDVSGRLISWHFSSIDTCNGRLSRGKIGGKTESKFSDPEEFWRYLYSITASNYTTWVIGHNILSHLILAGLPDRFQRGEISIDRPRSKRIREENDESDSHSSALAVLEAPPTVIGCRVGSTQGRIVFCDILNWFPGELSTTIASSGLGTTVEDANCNSCNGTRHDKISRVNQIHRLFEGLIDWVSTNEMGLFRYTASAQALGAFRHRFMRQQIYVHDNKPVQVKERRAYFGGRSDVFRKGIIADDTFQLDVNGLFPSVMRNGWFPARLIRYEEREGMISLLPSLDWSTAVAEVELDTRKPLYPLRTDSHTIFPVGIFKTYLCGQELFNAHKSGSIRKVGFWAEYELQPIFSYWVDELYAMRMRYKQEGNLLYEQFTKRIMNSLYGKFAQLTPNWVNVKSDYSVSPFTTESRLDYKTGKWTTLRAVGWQVQRLEERKEKEGSFYAISAFVTAAARCRMNWLRSVAGKKNVFYQGVDSLIVNRHGYRNLTDDDEVHESELGKMRLQHSANFGEIRGISDYELGHKQVVSSRTLNYETSDTGDVMQHKFYVMQHLFKNGPVDNIIEKLDDWNRTNSYKKGQVGQDGWVSPLELGTYPISASDGSSPELAASADRSITS